MKLNSSALLFVITFSPACLWADAEADFATALTKAETGDPKAQVEVGEDYYWGKGVTKDYAQSFSWFSKAAKQDCIQAETDLAHLYDQGQGVDKDPAQAFNLFLKAANKGDLVSERVVAKRYQVGAGVAPNLTKAVAWYKKAAIAGDTIAQGQLGYYLLTGKGIQKDEKLGFAYILNSAGIASSRYAAACCYSSGCFVSKDKSKAYMWSLLALDLEPKNSDYLAQAGKLKADLTESQITAALQGADAKRKFLQNGDLQTDELTISFSGLNSATLPFRMIAGAMVITLNVSDKEDLDFIVDTGCSVSSFDARLAADLGLTGNDYIPVSGSGADIALTTITDGVKITASGLTIDRMHGVLLPNFELDEILGLPLGGILGFDILKHFVVTIDFQNNTITFCDPKFFKIGEGIDKLPFRIDRNRPFVNAVLVSGKASAAGRFLLDTGDNDYATITKVFQNSHADLLLRQDADNAAIGIGGISGRLEGKCDQLIIGNQTLHSPIIAVSKEQHGDLANLQGGSIGTKVLNRFEITIDGPNQVLYLKPNANFTKPAVSTIVGMGFKAIRSKYDTFMVYAVIPGSPAATAGIQAGDFILKVDGVDTIKMKASDIYESIPREGAHQLDLMRNSDTIHAVLTPTVIQ